MFKKLGLAVVSTLVVSALTAPIALAAPGHGPGSIGPSGTTHTGPGPGPGPSAPPGPGPGPGGSDFILTGLTAVNSDANPTEIDMTVTVEQAKPDGSDFQESSNSTSETHDFPSTIYVYLTNNGTTTGPYAATLDSTVGITYLKNAAKGTTVSATANYTLVPIKSNGTNLLSNLSGGQTLTMSLYSSATQGDTKTFRMGPYADGSWSDDIVGGTGGVNVSFKTVTPSTTVSATVSGQAVVNETQTYDWNLTNTPCVSNTVIGPGQSQTLQYTVQATRSLTSDTKQTNVTGTVYVTNQGSQPTQNLQIVASLTGISGASMNIVPSEQIQPGQTASYPVKFAVPGNSASSYTLDANVTITNETGNVGTTAGTTAQEDISVPATPVVTTVDGTATISDAVTMPTGFTYTSLGLSDPWTFNDSNFVIFGLTVNNVSASAGNTYEIGNTATLVEGTTNTTQTADANVQVSTGS